MINRIMFNSNMYIILYYFVMNCWKMIVYYDVKKMIYLEFIEDFFVFYIYQLIGEVKIGSGGKLGEVVIKIVNEVGVDMIVCGSWGYGKF